MDSAPNIELPDDKNLITEIAFGVDDALLGKPLAKPLQRGIAMSIDAFLVLMLTHIGAVFWALAAGFSIFKFGKKSKQKRWRFVRYTLRVIGGFTVFVTMIVLFNNSFNDDEFSEPSGMNVNSVDSLANSIKLGAIVLSLTNKLEQGECDYACYHPLVEEVLDALVKVEFPSDEVYEFIDDNSKELPIDSEQERLEYVAQLYDYYQNAQSRFLESSDRDSSDIKSTSLKDVNSKTTPVNDDNETVDQTANQQPNRVIPNQTKTKQPVYSILEFGKGIIADLGLGFGWAALYFTAFPAWWRGQTPGKRLMGIRVIQLNGTYMSAWDSFGRYGGYGAGFATGLLGFFQIYWDSNRQAIQDKISATVVIKGDL